MKISYPPGHILSLWVAFLALLSSSRVTLCAAQPPSISAMRQAGSNVVVEVQVPAGLRMVRLESMTGLASGSWTPRAIARLDGTGGSVSFTLPNRRELEVMRVSAAESEDLPAAFYQGTNEFPAVVSASGVPSTALYAGATGTLTPGTEDSTTPSAGGAGGSTRTVTESDIWRVAGNRIYFFNALRGLQVIDIEDPDQPSLRGTLALPAAGEKLYLLDDQTVVLLVQASCFFGGQQSQVLLVSTKSPQPEVIARLPIDGYLTESRLVGTALYVAAQTYEASEQRGQTVYSYGTRLHSFDLSQPATPRAVGTLWYPGYNAVVSATDRLFFVVTQDPADWTHSVIHTVDITDPSGEMYAYVDIRPAGVIRDKFKLDYQGSRFTCISEEQNELRRTRLETFFLADPRSDGPISLRKEGELRLAERESLFATRFDGDKAYIVTFQRVDPLFVIDLSHPAAPKVVSELQVPGFSTFIQPLGDRLVTVGTETNRVAVSLFDVKDPAKPSLLSRVLLGNSYSWSESLWNEKAVSILPEEGLILVPYTGDSSNGYSSRVQLIDLSDSQLKARGQITRAMEARRATMHQGRIYSISSRELLVVGAEDRDHPEVKRALDLGWSVDRVLVHGDYLLELSDQARWWGSETLTQLRVSRAGEFDRAVATLTLSNLSILGAELRDGLLYLAQAQGSSAGWRLFAADQIAATPDDAGRGLGVFTTIDVRDPLKPKVLGQTSHALADSWGSSWQALWPQPELLVWYSSGDGIRGYGNPIGLFPGGVAFDVAIPWWGWSRAIKPLLVALEVGTPSVPVVKAVTSLGQENWWGATAAFQSGSLVYFGHQESDAVEEPIDPSKSISGGAGAVTAPDLVFPYRPYHWRQRHFLDVVDFSAAAQPVLRDPVSLPGALQGISRAGQVVYTLDQELDTASSPTGRTLLSALAYDGVAAHRIDSLPLDTYWTTPVRVLGEELLVGRIEIKPDNSSAGRLETWALDAKGRWDRRGFIGLPAPIQSLTQRGRLVVVVDQSFRLLDASEPVALKEVGRSAGPICWWGDPSKGDGDLDRGFWVPMGDYGINYIPRDR